MSAYDRADAVLSAMMRFDRNESVSGEVVRNWAEAIRDALAEVVLEAKRSSGSSVLPVPPETLAWWDQRSVCERCEHMRSILLGDGRFGGWRCSASRMVQDVRAWRRGSAAALTARNIRPFCIDARAADGDCGPEARLFKEKQ